MSYLKDEANNLLKNLGFNKDAMSQEAWQIILDKAMYALASMGSSAVMDSSIREECVDFDFKSFENEWPTQR